ncbi:MAG TPA: hypothetical protein VH107_14165 [Lacipirellulaceae bacterium]|nr:hypothetical protein [Lacipirellulaceae bacterium]
MSSRLLLLVLFAVCWGCGSDSPFKYVRASGRITYEDGSPIPGGIRLMFVPDGIEAIGNAHARMGIANVDSTGKVESVTSYKPGDGLVPGKHKVVIQGAADRGGTPAVPKEDTAAETTKITVDTNSLPFEIKVPKPK